ncbi:MAG: hypothetical protein RI935_434 [Candidatus Parcubacteria bacterium]|jgi:predicted nucleic acid-binding protein
MDQYSGFLIDSNVVIGLLVPDEELSSAAADFVRKIGSDLGKKKRIFVSETSIEETAIVLLRKGYHPEDVQKAITKFIFDPGVVVLKLSFLSFIKAVHKFHSKEEVKKKIRDNFLRTTDLTIAAHSLAIGVPLVTFDKNLYVSVRLYTPVFTADNIALLDKEKISSLS